jgi:uncharacterized membrane protein YeaQ/YmgE (transglycosylase-associated protein family)
MTQKIISIIIQCCVGIAAGIYFVKVVKKSVFGHIWGAIVLGIIGSVLGGFFLDSIIVFLTNNMLTVNFVACLVGAFFLIWLVSKITH